MLFTSRILKRFGFLFCSVVYTILGDIMTMLIEWGFSCHHYTYRMMLSLEACPSCLSVFSHAIHMLRETHTHDTICLKI